MFLALSPLLLPPAARRRCFHQVFGSTLSFFSWINFISTSKHFTSFSFKHTLPQIIIFFVDQIQNPVLCENHTQSKECRPHQDSFEEAAGGQLGLLRRSSTGGRVNEGLFITNRVFWSNNIIWYIATSIFILSNIRQERQELSTRESRLAEAKVL